MAHRSRSRTRNLRNHCPGLVLAPLRSKERVMERTTDISRGHAVGGGIVAGIIGGVVLAIILSIMYAAHGQSVWLAMKGAGAPFLHERAMQPGFDAPAVLLGLVAHFAVSIV